MLFLTFLFLALGGATTYALFPTLFRLIGRAFGNNLRGKTQQRRELLFTRAAAQEKEQASKDTSTNPNLTSSSSSTDEEWEKVHDGDKTPIPASTDSSRDFDGLIGFLHPFCNAGGGGERVLFAAVLATQRRYPNALCVIYTGDHDASKEQILTNVRNRFNIDLNPARVDFLYLNTREWVLASKWPHFTLLGQSLGSLYMGWDAFNLVAPDIFIDTMGYAFVLALCKWLFPKVPTAAYVHYPTISTDMLESLQSEVSSGHGSNAGQGKGAKGQVKQKYWELFAALYGWVGGWINVVMTNSTWTQNHIQALWSKPRTQRGQKHSISVVYPPCAVEELQSKIPVNAESEKSRTRNLLYIAQFRPEKMHQTVIEAFQMFLKEGANDPSHPSQTQPKPKLILVGSARDDSDEKRVYKLRLQAQEIKDRVEFVVNKPWKEVLKYLKSSSTGVNGMWNEHFGIGVVEYQAAGLISVVNDSGGPKEDIVVDIDGKPTGYHASTPADFSKAFAKALALTPDEAFAMRERARKSSLRFSERVFSDAWIHHLELLVDLAKQQKK